MGRKKKEVAVVFAGCDYCITKVMTMGGSIQHEGISFTYISINRLGPLEIVLEDGLVDKREQHWTGVCQEERIGLDASHLDRCCGIFVV